MREFVEKAGIPFYTTPQGRGVVPDDHPYSYLTMRNSAFREADLIIILGTRMNYVIGHAAPPRFNKDAKIARIEIDPEELGMSARNVDIPVVGDCKSVLTQLIDAIDGRTAERSRRGARSCTRARRQAHRPRRQLSDRWRHPPAAAVRRNQELHETRRDPVRRRAGDPEFRAPVDPDLYAGPSTQFGAVRHDGRGAAVRGRRQGRETRERRSSACMATARSARTRWSSTPRSATNCRCLCVISLNGGWTADPERNKPGRDLGYTRYDIMAQGLGCHGEYVEEPEEIRPALERAQKKVDEGMVALVNVKTDYRARATTVQFSSRMT